MNRLFTTLVKPLVLFLLLTIVSTDFLSAQHSIAREWNELTLKAIRTNAARPTVIARNLYHHSIAMYDAWAAYDSIAETVFLGKELGTYVCPFDGVPVPADIEAARQEAISFASYRLLRHRYEFPVENVQRYNDLMAELGYDINDLSLDYSDGVPAHLGNYIASEIIGMGYSDGSNEQTGYQNQYYDVVNPLLDMEERGNSTIVDFDRWQQLSMIAIWDQNCSSMFNFPQQFLSPEWGNVVPFAIPDSLRSTYDDNRGTWQVYMDPGPPAMFNDESGEGNEYRWGHQMVGVWSSHLDPDDTTLWDISPASIGNIDLDSMPDAYIDYPEFYNFFDGGDASVGHETNPSTGLPYEPQIVKRSDYARILAEFWADGPDSEAPPGHWYTIYNEVSDYPEFTRKWAGVGASLDTLQYDVQAYLTLGGAVHDAAVAAWSIKGYYDYLRPVSALRGMADVYGQRTDSTLVDSYHPDGIDLIPGYIEVIQEGDPLITDTTQYLLNEIKMMCWLGPGDAIPCEDTFDEGTIPQYPTDVAHVGWKPIAEWWPYQRPSFVTPPFAGYISGHSTFSRAAAEVMTAITGDNFFPGGIGVFECPADSFLVFEEGPSEDIQLQWATYQDASDQCSLSRIWGGIHPPCDDIPGRKIGYEIGHFAFDHAQSFFDPTPPSVVSAFASDNVVTDEDTPWPLTVTVIYDEPMDPERTPTVSTDVALMGLFLSEMIWTNDSTLLINYTLSDMEEDIDSFSIIVDGAQDYAGNEQTASAIVFAQIDTQNPTIVASDVQEVGAPVTSFVFTFELSETMDTSSTLLLETPVEDALANSLVLSNAHWLDSLTYEMTYELIDAEEEIDLIDIQLSQATDSLGNPMVITSLPDVFSIDTKNPVVTLLTPSATLINDEVSSSEMFTLQMVFDEEMDQSMAPIITFDNGTELDASVIADPINSAWTDSVTYSQAYLLMDADVDIPVITGVVMGGNDLALNPSVDFVLNEPFSIDTRNPLVELISASTDDVDNGTHGTGSFTILLTFDEDMDEATTPILEFPDEDPLALSLVPNEGLSTWLSPQMYEMRYDVLDVTEVLENVDVASSAATDVVGNVQVDFTLNDLFSIHLDEALSIFELGGIPIGRVYPNPAEIGESINISFTENVNELTIQMMDLSGRLVLQDSRQSAGQSLSIDLDGLSEGMYLLLLESEGRRSLLKVQLSK